VQESKAGQENKLSTTIMKKLFSLALIAIVAFVAGCKPADSGTTPPSTNAPAAK
jgi:hypothetical protein